MSVDTSKMGIDELIAEVDMAFSARITFLDSMKKVTKNSKEEEWYEHKLIDAETANKEVIELLRKEIK